MKKILGGWMEVKKEKNLKEIPSGWRELEEGEVIGRGDKYLSNINGKKCWKNVAVSIGEKYRSEWSPTLRKIRKVLQKPTISNEIPDGWVEVKRGQVIKEGDKCRFKNHNYSSEWHLCKHSVGQKLGREGCHISMCTSVVITKIPQKPTISKEQLAIKIAQLVNKYNINNK